MSLSAQAPLSELMNETAFGIVDLQLKVSTSPSNSFPDFDNLFAQVIAAE